MPVRVRSGSRGACAFSASWTSGCSPGWPPRGFPAPIRRSSGSAAPPTTGGCGSPRPPCSRRPTGAPPDAPPCAVSAPSRWPRSPSTPSPSGPPGAPGRCSTSYRRSATSPGSRTPPPSRRDTPPRRRRSRPASPSSPPATAHWSRRWPRRSPSLGSMSACTTPGTSWPVWRSAPAPPRSPAAGGRRAKGSRNGCVPPPTHPRCRAARTWSSSSTGGPEPDCPARSCRPSSACASCCPGPNSSSSARTTTSPRCSPGRPAGPRGAAARWACAGATAASTRRRAPRPATGSRSPCSPAAPSTTSPWTWASRTSTTPPSRSPGARPSRWTWEWRHRRRGTTCSSSTPSASGRIPNSSGSASDWRGDGASGPPRPSPSPGSCAPRPPWNCVSTAAPDACGCSSPATATTSPTASPPPSGRAWTTDCSTCA